MCGWLPASPTALRFHPARDVDRIAPRIICELAITDDAGDDRPGIHADPEAERFANVLSQSWHLGQHVERHVGNCLGMVGARHGQPGDHHVGVADGFDFLQAMTLGKVIKGGKHLVQHIDQRMR